MPSRCPPTTCALVTRTPWSTHHGRPAAPARAHRGDRRAARAAATVLTRCGSRHRARPHPRAYTVACSDRCGGDRGGALRAGEHFEVPGTKSACGGHLSGRRGPGRRRASRSGPGTPQPWSRTARLADAAVPAHEAVEVGVAVEVVGLVLQAAGEVAGARHDDLGAPSASTPRTSAARRDRSGRLAGHRQAALVVVVGVRHGLRRRVGGEHGVDDDAAAVLAVELGVGAVEDEDAAVVADLVRGQPDAVGGVHRVEQVVDEGAQRVAAELLGRHRAGRAVQHRFSDDEDGPDGHGGHRSAPLGGVAGEERPRCRGAVLEWRGPNDRRVIRGPAPGEREARSVADAVRVHPPQDEPSDGLDRRDREILAFERQWWKYAAPRNRRSASSSTCPRRATTRCSTPWSTVPEALAADPMLVKRLRRLRQSRQRARAARRLGVEPR